MENYARQTYRDFMKDYEDVLQPGNYYLHLSK